MVVLSQIDSKTSAHNFIRIHSDLAFLSHIVLDLLFSRTVYAKICSGMSKSLLQSFWTNHW